MPYLNLDLDYFQHPKTMRIITRLGLGAEILPLKLWAFAGKFCVQDGAFRGYSEHEIEEIAGWRGERGAMIHAMLEIGFLKQMQASGAEKSYFRINKWSDHQGHLFSFKKRAYVAAKARWAKIKAPCSKNATSITEECYGDAPTKALPTEAKALKKLGAAEPLSKPSDLKTVKEYFQSMGHPSLEADKFFDYFSANGWKVGGKAPMKDWRAAARNWMRNSGAKPNFQQPRPQTVSRDRERLEREAAPPPPEFKAMIENLAKQKEMPCPKISR